MSEKFPSTFSAEKWRAEQAALFMADFPQAEVVQDSREQCVMKIEELKALFEQFEQKHDLAALRAITTITAAEALAHPLRRPAADDLGPIVALINYLETQNESRGEFPALKARYREFDRAVGNVNNNITADHSRP